jgi:hypothetical protein
MTYRIPRDHPLRRLFRGMVEQVFMADVGICDPRVTTYLSEMLGEFVHIDQIYRLRNVTGETIRELSRMEADAYLGPDRDDTERRRIVHRFMGDFTLFWTGLYPENLHRPNSLVDRLGEYVLQGKRSYGIASELSEGLDDPPAELLRRLSREFEICMHGLHLVREGIRRLDEN